MELSEYTIMIFLYDFSQEKDIFLSYFFFFKIKEKVFSQYIFHTQNWVKLNFYKLSVYRNV